MYEIINGEKLVLGTCYYPEHWPESMWEEDLKRMLEAGITVVRVAEFAWNKVEPREGVFTYDFWDRFLDIAEKTGMKVIFSTPTATPPAWLTNKYPEVLNADMDGNLYRHGARRHYNYNSPVYREFSARITKVFAQHYAKRSCIIGWQIDNEFNCEMNEFYSESDTLAFRKFLQEKYQTLDVLNEAWGTVFWNQTYSEWEEIYIPRKTCSNSTNPHEVLDYYRFISGSARSFAKMQSDILRKYIKQDDFITTNGMFGHLDNHKLTQESLDFYTYDSYPNFAYCLDAPQNRPNDLKDRKWSRNLAEVRSVSPIFGIMEQQSGANGWNTRMEACSPRPGQLTLWTMQSIAHGADYISYFRWRTCTQGTEIYWHGILDYSGRENSRLREVKQVYEKLQNMQEIAGAVYEAKVGIVKDYDNIFDSEVDVWHGRVEEQSQKALFTALQITHTPFDYVYLDSLEDDAEMLEKLQKYEVLFYPHASLISKKRAEVLQKYVAAGGKLVLGCRSGYKDMTGKCVMNLLPGLFREMTGADVFEYSFIPPDTDRVTIDWDGAIMEASVFVDRLQTIEMSEGTGLERSDAVEMPEETGLNQSNTVNVSEVNLENAEAKIEAVYTSDYFAGNGALVSNTYGKGKAYYYGTAFTIDSAKVFLKKLQVISPYNEFVTLPEGCEIAVREKAGMRYFFILNYLKEKVDITIHMPMKNLYTGNVISGIQSLKAYETLVLEAGER